MSISSKKPTIDLIYAISVAKFLTPSLIESINDAFFKLKNLVSHTNARLRIRIYKFNTDEIDGIGHTNIDLATYCDDPYDYKFDAIQDYDAKGLSPLGAMLRQINDDLERTDLAAVMLISNGAAKDIELYDQELARLEKLKDEKNISTIGFKIGQFGDKSNIKRFAGGSSNTITCNAEDLASEIVGTTEELINFVNDGDVIEQTVEFVLPDVPKEDLTKYYKDLDK